MSTRDTKKLATDDVGRIAAGLDEPLEPTTYASATAAWRSSEKMSVTLIERPAAIESSIAPSPGTVAGIFTNRLGVDELVEQLRLLEGRVPLVREVGIDLERDEPVDAVGPVPHRAQKVARALDVLDGEREEDLLRVVGPVELRRSCSSYQSPVDSAFSKIVGFEVTPTTASSSISRCELARLEHLAARANRPRR